MKFNTAISWFDHALFDENGGGGAPDAQAGAPSPGNGTPAAPASGQPQESGSPAAPAAGTPPVQLYRPEGMPEHMLGKSDTETIDNMAKALKGYRERDGQVPEKPDSYKNFEQVDDTIKPFVSQLTEDPLFDRLTEKAKERGIPLSHFQGMTTDLMALAAEMGVLEPPIDTAKERELLTPDGARHLPVAEQEAARNKRMQDNFAWLDMQVKKDGEAKGLSKEAADFAKMMLGDRAVGHEFIEFMRGKAGGGGQGPMMGAAPASGTDLRKALAEKMALPEMQKGHPKFSQSAYDALVQEYQKVVGK